MSNKKWLEFVQVERPNRKTKVFVVMPIGSNYELGEIKWYAQWRHYCFFPTLRFETVHSDRCLIEISEFITKINIEHKGG